LCFTFVVAAYLVSTPHSSGFARLVRLRRGAFYFAIPILTFCETIKIENRLLPEKSAKVMFSLKTELRNTL